MKRSRLIIQCSSAASAAIVAAFLLLIVLHASLRTLPIQEFDLATQGLVHRWASPALTKAIRALSLIGSTEFFVPILILAALIMLRIGLREQGQGLVRKRQISGIFFLALGGAIVLNDTFKAWFHRLRPAPAWALAHESTYSFPSGHSLFAIVLYGLIAYKVLDRHTPGAKRLLVLLAAAAMTLAIGTSRIYLGVHWPTDVLAGYLTGGLWLTAVIYIDRRWRTPWPAC